MARVSLARQLLADTGVMAAYSPAAAEGHCIENNGKVILHVCNNSADDITVKILSGYERAGLKLADREVIVGEGNAVFIGPFDPDIYNQADGNKGQVYVDYSAVENITVAALLLP